MWTLMLWTGLLLQIPANVLALYVGLRIKGASVPFKRVAAYGAALGIVLTLLRAYFFGLHLPVHVVLLLLMIQYLSGGRWAMSVLSTLLVHISAFIGEGFLVVPLMTRLGIPLADTLVSPLLYIGAGWLGNIPLLLGLVYLLLMGNKERVAADHARP